MAPSEKKAKHIVAKIKADLRIRRRLKTRIPNFDCPLVSLDPSLTVAITRYLPPHSQILLSQTCRSLRSFFGCILPPERKLSEKLSEGETYDFLTCLARNKPDQWACEQCLKLHNRPFLKPAPDNILDCFCPRGPLLHLYKLGKAQYAQHHIQLALKYARINEMDCGQMHWLNTVLATRKGLKMLASSPEDGVIGKLSYVPKIVKERFLIHSTSYFTVKFGSKLKAGFLRRWKICEHQLLLGQYSQRLQRETVSHPLQPEYYFWKTMLSAFKAKGDEVRGYCPLCPTDFSVQARPGKMTLRVWIDLGPENSPSDVLWKAQTSRNLEGCFEYEEPGRVRRLYESERGRIAPPKPKSQPLSKAKAAASAGALSCLDTLVQDMFSDKVIQRMSRMAFPTQ
ncbi:hypothetical protein B0T10DRAFT_578718 [Thelonectria olida]|uniref:F-box domain-containing protein n=1 Tax=Thelonectria olida TaxID=1576542 RepID=A0A9P9AT12_9HYPO|nr:hypothetical protein B0T10DRAFT_578718 [Thelonectria olida]